MGAYWQYEWMVEREYVESPNTKGVAGLVVAVKWRNCMLWTSDIWIKYFHWEINPGVMTMHRVSFYSLEDRLANNISYRPWRSSLVRFLLLKFVWKRSYSSRKLLHSKKNVTHMADDTTTNRTTKYQVQIINIAERMPAIKILQSVNGERSWLRQ